MVEKRVTKKENFTEIRDILVEMGRDDLVAFVDNELDLLAKRASKKTLTKVQKENLELVEEIYNTLAGCETPVTVTELMSILNGDFSSQKITALLKKLVDSERAVKVTEKGKTYYSIAD